MVAWFGAVLWLACGVSGFIDVISCSRRGTVLLVLCVGNSWCLRWDVLLRLCGLVRVICGF